MDGKHVMIKPPAQSGSYYFNYKHSFSIVLLAVVDANYKFVYVNVGCNGRILDGGVFCNCDLYKELEENQMNIPEADLISGMQAPFPYVIVADDAFPLKPFSRTGTNSRQEDIQL